MLTTVTMLGTIYTISVYFCNQEGECRVCNEHVRTLNNIITFNILLSRCFGNNVNVPRGDYKQF